LTKAWECLRWKTLPRAGGYDDQPIGLMNRMNAALTIYEMMTVYCSAEKAGVIDEAWMASHRREMSVWSQVQIMRARIGDQP
jgi:hypothetical protein